MQWLFVLCIVENLLEAIYSQQPYMMFIDLSKILVFVSRHCLFLIPLLSASISNIHNI